MKNNNTKSCGCLQKERLTERNRSNESLIGQKFGRLTVLALDTAKKRRSWISQCECGNIVSISTRHLKIGNTKSCGCFKKEYDSEPIHGYSHHPLYVKWSSIKARCTNKENISYKNYGGRGIKLCSEWFNNPEKFIEYVIVLENYGLKGYSLDRINNDGDYEPRNVRWATREQQRQNSRNLVFNPELIKKIRHHYNTKGGTYKELSELFNTNVNNIYDILTNKTWKNIV